MKIGSETKFLAAVRDRYGTPEVLTIREMELPHSLSENEILIRVSASTVNRTDCAILSGEPFVMRFFTGLIRPSMQSTGTDFAGKVVAVGSKVTQFSVGDRVFGFDDTGIGSHAQYLKIAQSKPIAKIPVGADEVHAAASLEGAHYAYNFINKVDLKAGQKALLNGATGAIGSALLQFLKYFGVHVTAVCGTQQVDRVRSMGADQVVDYQREDFTTSDVQFDYVFDAVGKSTFGRCKRILSPKGIYISSELGPHAQNVFLAVFTPWSSGQKVIFPVPSHVPRSLAFVCRLIEEGRFKALVDRTLPLNQIQEAFRYVASGQKIGNVVLTME